MQILTMGPIVLPENIQKISATKIRKNIRKKGKPK